MSFRPGRRALLRAATCLLPTGDVTRAGVASVDASWHLGAGGGQFAEDVDSSGTPSAVYGGQVDPFLHATKKRPARGIQSRTVTRALVVEGVNDERFASSPTTSTCPTTC